MCIRDRFSIHILFSSYLKLRWTKMIKTEMNYSGPNYRIKLKKPNWFTVDTYWRKMCHDSNANDIRAVKCNLAWHVICYWLHRIKILQWKRKFTLIPLFMVLFKTKMMIENKMWKKILLFVFLHSKASLHAMDLLCMNK